jgi:hypothetical protein
MSTKVTVYNRIPSLKSSEAFLKKEMNYLANEDPKYVLAFFVNKNLPLSEYRNVDVGWCLGGKYKDYS